MKTSRILRTGIIQQHNTADIAGNRRRIMDKIRTLAADGARLIVNQELHDSLYFCQTENVNECDLALPLDDDAILAYGKLAAELRIVIVLSLIHI